MRATSGSSWPARDGKKRAGSDYLQIPLPACTLQTSGAVGEAQAARAKVAVRASAIRAM